MAAATVPLGFLAASQGWVDRRWVLVGVSALPPALATLVAAWRESQSEPAATPGKRWQELSVGRAGGGTPSLPRALLRNAVKIGIPWQLGHVAAMGAAYGGFEQRDAPTYASTMLVYPLIIAMIVVVVFGRGLGLHDRVTGTWVDSGRW